MRLHSEHFKVENSLPLQNHAKSVLDLGNCSAFDLVCTESYNLVICRPFTVKGQMVNTSDFAGLCCSHSTLPLYLKNNHK